MNKKRSLIFIMVLLVSLMFLLVGCSTSNIAGKASGAFGSQEKPLLDKGDTLYLSCSCMGRDGRCQVEGTGELLSCQKMSGDPCTGNCHSAAVVD